MGSINLMRNQPFEMYRIDTSPIMKDQSRLRRVIMAVEGMGSPQIFPKRHDASRVEWVVSSREGGLYSDTGGVGSPG